MRVIWSKRATGHLARIFEFNLSRSFDWAERVESRIHERIADLPRLPLIGRPLPNLQVRALSLPDIQYVVHYRVDADRVLILRVLSTREIR